MSLLRAISQENWPPMWAADHPGKFVANAEGEKCTSASIGLALSPEASSTAPFGVRLLCHLGRRPLLQE